MLGNLSRIVSVERTFKALANRRRLAIVKFLASRARADVGSIAEHIRLSFAATSRHLRTLAAADLVESTQESTTVYYSLPQRRSLALETALKLIR